MDQKNTEGKKSKQVSRRNFLGTFGAAAAYTIVPRNVLGGAGYTAPSDMVNVAGIGVGARGASDIRGISDPDVPLVNPANGNPLIAMTPLPNRQAPRPANAPNAQQLQAAQAQRPPVKLANIYALCDVDHEKAGWLFKGYPKAKIYTDWREMLDKEKSIDAVTIATPDHNHAVIAAAWMRAKKHVYVEKPLCKTVFESRKLREIAKEMNVVTQMGNQGHATEGTRQTVEWIQSGLIGSVRDVQTYTNAPSWPQGYQHRPAGVAVPKNLNYDVWIGPAPMKPYHPDILHFNWRGLRDYGTGAMGDFGAHILDAVVWSLNLDYPTRLQATSTPFSDDYLPDGEQITYEFAARGTMPAVKVSWADGGLKPARPKELPEGKALSAATYYGDKGIIMHSTHGAIPEIVSAPTGAEKPAPWMERTGNIYEDFIGAIKAGKKSTNDFAVSGKLAEIMLLGNIAVLMQKTNTVLEYDAANMKFTNSPEANDLLHYEYRKGWTL